ncbi:hypothetical protein [Actinomyces mediterranea]|uniref:hypothetical protein n=1 Tax=Actinomyces mediterranea TaxID=1871028 RepID=UPI0019670F9B|nr:hypothetical protein [Actinomyces mediterranea]
MMNVRPLLVLDEPTVGLDPLTRAALWNAFRSAPRRPPLRLLGRLRLHDAIQAAILCAVGYGFLGVKRRATPDGWSSMLRPAPSSACHSAS